MKGAGTAAFELGGLEGMVLYSAIQERRLTTSTDLSSQ